MWQAAWRRASGRWIGGGAHCLPDCTADDLQKSSNEEAAHAAERSEGDDPDQDIRGIDGSGTEAECYEPATYAAHDQARQASNGDDPSQAAPLAKTRDGCKVARLEPSRSKSRVFGGRLTLIADVPQARANGVSGDMAKDGNRQERDSSDRHGRQPLVKCQEHRAGRDQKQQRPQAKLRRPERETCWLRNSWHGEWLRVEAKAASLAIVP